MTKPLVALASLVLASAALAQSGGTKQAPSPTKAPAVGVTMGTNPAPPPGSVPAEIKDVRVLDRNPDDPYEYERLGLGAVQGGDLVHARTFFEQSWKYGELPTAAYNLACIDAREGKTEAAFAQLDRAVAVGFDDEKTLLSDPDLASLRAQSRFQGIVATSRKNRTEGDASVVRDGTFLAPKERPIGILLLLHDASSDPLSASAPFLDAAQARGLYVAVPRGPARAGRKRFGWGTKERALTAVTVALAEARRRTGNPGLPVFVAGVGKGGSLAFTAAVQRAGVYAGVGSVGGPYDPGSGNPAQAPAEASALRGARLFFGVAQDAPHGLVAAIGRGVDALKQYGLQPALRYWAGSGTGLPSKNTATAVKETLDGIMGTGGTPR